MSLRPGTKKLFPYQEPEEILVIDDCDWEGCEKRGTKIPSDERFPFSFCSAHLRIFENKRVHKNVRPNAFGKMQVYARLRR